MAIFYDTAATLKRHGPALTTAVTLHIAAAAAIHAGMRDVEPPRREEVRKVVAQLITLPRRIEPQQVATPQKATPSVPSKARPQVAAQPAPQSPVAAAATNALSEAPKADAAPAPQAAATSAPVAPPAPVAVSAPRFDAAYLNNPKPVYPLAARRFGEEGTVLLHVRVSADGLPAKIEVRTSSGSERLDEAARAAVAQWRFVPAKQGDEAVAAWVLVPLVFRMNG